VIPIVTPDADAPIKKRGRPPKALPEIAVKTYN
jgi:hypothetical protein